MNKRDLVECVAAELGGSRTAAEKAVKAVLDSILDGVDRNPRTGETLEIPASSTVAFRPAAALKRSAAAV
jgi:nucleoid DNA-binding protein